MRGQLGAAEIRIALAIGDLQQGPEAPQLANASVQKLPVTCL